MKKVKTLILRTAGTNCDMETAHAFKLAGSAVESLHINALMKKKSALDDYQILAIPGGFTYGDDIASGKVLANELNNSLKSELSRFIKAGKLIIGICNGFQVLVKMGLLPNTKNLSTRTNAPIEATLGLNNSGKFEDRWIYLKNGQEARGKRQEGLCVWTKDLPEVIYLPVAHGEGKFIPKNQTILNALEKNGQIVFRYTSSDGKPTGYPGNPNGSIEDIAGITDATGRILGMMPHPERYVTYTQHPHWQRLTGKVARSGIGLHIFKNGVHFVKNNL
jgi:phosphoribosylformylglycinamidine synthase subunit PurQ / glutaminase